MSWLDRRLVVLMSLAPLLTGCFQPMYGGAGGAALKDTMMAVAVDPIPNRIGHYLGNNLIFALNGTGAQVAPKYHLIVTVRERLTTPLVDTITAQATSATLAVDADYRLMSPGGDDPVTHGTAFALVSYDRTSQPFANISAAADAEIRAAETLSDQIHTRLAIALSPKS